MAEPAVLVTGCAGFIGSNLCRELLRAGHRVVGLDDLSAGTEGNVAGGVEFHRRDIRDAGIGELFDGVEVVFHLAARNCLVDCLEHPVETADINVKGTVQVLEACRLARVRKLVYAETSAVYEGVEELPSVESRVYPMGPYAVSKHAGAWFVRSHGRLHGLRNTILRYFNVYGPAQDYRRRVPPVVCSFILRMLRGDPPMIYGDGSQRRDFVHVDDVNRFHRLCLVDERTDGRTFNVGSGTNHSILEIHEAIAELLGSALRPVFTGELPGDVRATLADLTAARSVGWEPTVSLRDGLSRAIDDLKATVEPAGSRTMTSRPHTTEGTA